MEEMGKRVSERREFGRVFLSAVLAGALIALGGCAWLLVENKYVGALLFCFGLYGVCAEGLWLFTGKVGYIYTEKGLWRYAFRLLITGLGNFIGATFIALIANIGKPGVASAAEAVVASRMAQGFAPTYALSVLCGVIMFIAVDTWKKTSKPYGVLLGIPLFLLCGFEHSVADMFFFVASGTLTVANIIHVVLVSLGNAIGSILVCALAVHGGITL